MLINKTTNPEEISKLADCEPSQRQRETLSSDLKIKGPRTCPSNIDMRAIIPVYDMNPDSRQLHVFPKILVGADLGGTNNHTNYVLPQNPHELNMHTIFRNIYFEVYTDMLGQAALSGEWIILEFFVRQAQPSGVNIDIIVGRVRWLVGPADTIDLHIKYCSNDDEPLYGTMAEITQMAELAPYCRWRWTHPFRLDQNARLMMLLYTTAALFPVPFPYNIGSLVDFY